MSEFLAANPPTNQGLPLCIIDQPFLGPDLDPGFDIDTAGLSSTIHNELVDVNRTLTSLPQLQINSSLLLTVVRKREEKDSDYQGEQRVKWIQSQLPSVVLLAISSHC